MKYALILPDGAADEPLDELDGRTPLEAADTPGMDEIATSGRQGTLVTVPEGFPAGSDVCTLSVLGYHPRDCYTGRAPIEAAARGIELRDDQICFRCNFVTIVDEVMEDFTAGHISDREAAALVESLNAELGGSGVRFHAGVSYRNLMVIDDPATADVTATPPHDIIGQPIAKYLPTGKGSAMVRDLMQRSREVLAGHDVNQVRCDLGESPATSIWLWGQGRRPSLRSFESVYGVRGAAVGAVDLFRGLARLVGWEVIAVEGATGYIDTNFAGKGAAAVEALGRFDLAVVHVEAADEAGHNGDARQKIEAIEAIDRHVVMPVLRELQGFEEGWRILVAPDHPTPVARRTHTRVPPPFCMAGGNVHAVMKRPFTEANAAASDLHVDPGSDLMAHFLRR